MKENEEIERSKTRESTYLIRTVNCSRSKILPLIKMILILIKIIIVIIIIIIIIITIIVIMILLLLIK